MMAIGLLLAFLEGPGFGLAVVWLCEFALQALIRKGFFDPLSSAALYLRPPQTMGK